jgi:uncharacterized membrane protein
MILLVLGLALWWAAHLFKRVAPGPRQAMGNAGIGVIAVALFASVALMVVGFRGAEFVPVWDPPPFLRHVNNLLMVLALYLYLASATKVRVTRAIRHPQLTAFKIWAVAHLLVNGDLASVVLFGGLLAWAVVTVIAINRAVPRPAPPPPAPAAKEIATLVGTVVALGAVGWLHTWLGYNPFG